MLRVERVILAGITYDYIQLEIDPQLTSVSPSWKVTITNVTSMYGTIPCVDVDSKIKVFVPQNRLANMEIFLKLQQAEIFYFLSMAIFWIRKW